MRTWVKLYTESNRDPKVGTMTWQQRGIWCALLALAGELDARDDDDNPTGELDTPQAVAWHIRASQPELQDALDALIERQMVHMEAGVLFVTNFAKRQRRAPSDAREVVAERVKRHRNGHVTPLHPGVTASEEESESDSEGDADSEPDTEAEVEADAGRADVVATPTPTRGVPLMELVRRTFDREAINAETPRIIGELIERFGSARLEEAIKEMDVQTPRKRGWPYVVRILERWEAADPEPETVAPPRDGSGGPAAPPVVKGWKSAGAIAASLQNRQLPVGARHASPLPGGAPTNGAGDRNGADQAVGGAQTRSGRA